uniref:Reverse transcriptase/retrotransposon-derived protein RNase H-like domain-containing protein n=1 Tax=Anguilla anguilla TaxID=7936 RepID=A0A0E9QU96_ANGAN
MLQQLLENQLYVKAEKCAFHQESVSFLGFIVSAGGIQMDGSKVRAVSEWPIPKTCKDLQRFLGFAHFYRRFVWDHSKVAAPLTALTSTTIKFHWTDIANQTFNKLKRRFTIAPILTPADPSHQFIVEVGASDVGVGAVLSQRSGLDN